MMFAKMFRWMLSSLVVGRSLLKYFETRAESEIIDGQKPACKWNGFQYDKC